MLRRGHLSVWSCGFLPVPFLSGVAICPTLFLFPKLLTGAKAINNHKMNIKNAFVAILLLTLSLNSLSQSVSNGADTSTVKQVVLQKGYPITLLLLHEISSRFSQVGDVIKFAVKDDIVINGRTVIPKETPAFGTVSEVKPRAGLGKKGILNFSIDRLVFSSGRIININSDQKAAGQNKTGAMIATAAIISPLFLLKKGKDITFSPKKEFTAYTTEDNNF